MNIPFSAIRSKTKSVLRQIPEFKRMVKAFVNARKKNPICADCCRPIKGKVICEMCETCFAWNNRFDQGKE